MNDGTAQMGLQMGQSAMKVGQEYVEQNVRPIIHLPHAHRTNRYMSAGQDRASDMLGSLEIKSTSLTSIMMYSSTATSQSPP